MTLSQLFTAAHKLAKKFKGNYSACFSLAIKQIRAGLFTIKTIGGKKLTMLCEIAGIVMNDFGKCLNITKSIFVNGKKFETSSRFDFETIKMNNKDYNFMALKDALKIEREFEDKMNINQGVFGSQI